MSINQPDYESIQRAGLKQLLDDGKYEDTLENIALRVALNKEIEHTKSQYESFFQPDEILEELDWEALTMLRLYDQRTFEHSLNTYSVLRSKIESIRVPAENIYPDLAPDSPKIGTSLSIAEIIEETEGYTLKELYRAASLHDIGKMRIPKYVINNETPREEWQKKFEAQAEEVQAAQLEKLLQQEKLPLAEIKSITQNRQTMLDYINGKGISAIHLVPITKGMETEEVEALRQREIEPLEEPIGAIMRSHEKYSGEIFRLIVKKWEEETGETYPKKDLERIVELITHHHNYERDEKFLAQHPATVTSLDISDRLASILPQIISMADLKQAMEESRPYRNREADILDKYQEFIRRADLGFIDPFFTALWLDSDIKSLSPEDVRLLSDEKVLEFKEIVSWVESNKK